MAKRKQKLTTEWTEMLRNLEVGESFSCTVEERLSVGPIATRLKKTENMCFSITKKVNQKTGSFYEVLRLEDPVILENTEA